MLAEVSGHLDVATEANPLAPIALLDRLAEILLLDGKILGSIARRHRTLDRRDVNLRMLSVRAEEVSSLDA